MQDDISLVESLYTRCKARPGVLALPEDDDPRVVLAASRMLGNGLVQRVIFSDPRQTAAAAEVAGVDLPTLLRHCSFLSQDFPGIKERTAHLYQQQSASRGKSADDASTRRYRESRLAQCGELLHEGLCDAVVAGAIAPTAEVIRTAISTVGLTAGVRTISGSFLMLKDKEAPLLFADCGVVVSPNINQLVDIASESVKMWRTICPNVEPVVAFLSFSTKGSAEHPDAEKMAQATSMFKVKFPSIAADGELQFDAAFDRDIGARKAPGSPVPGKANIFLFPDLDAGNIAYKITQRLGGYHACGPLLQGLAKPFSDLSRGSTVEDIILTACINLLR